MAKRKKIRVNLTPLIDIIFLLVVFFLLTSKFIVSEAIDLNLSSFEGEGSDSSNALDALVITLLSDGKYRVSGKEYQLSNLKMRIGGLLKKTGKKEVVIVSLPEVNVQDLVMAMDHIRASGSINISLAEEE